MPEYGLFSGDNEELEESNKHGFRHGMHVETVALLVKKRWFSGPFGSWGKMGLYFSENLDVYAEKTEIRSWENGNPA